MKQEFCFKWNSAKDGAYGPEELRELTDLCILRGYDFNVEFGWSSSTVKKVYVTVDRMDYSDVNHFRDHKVSKAL